MLNGTKRFITNAPHAGVFTVMARTNFDIKGAGGISAFIVDSQTRAFLLANAIKMGQKAHIPVTLFSKIVASLLPHSLVVLKVLVLKQP